MLRIARRMRLPGPVALITACLSWLLLAPGPAEAQETPNSACRLSIDGHLVDVESHEPIAGATVTIDGVQRILSDENGHFLLTKLCPADVLLEIHRADYEPVLRAMPLSRNVSIEIEMRELLGEVVVIKGKSIAPLRLQATTSISGEDLERTRGRSFSDTLAEVPGVSQLRSASGMAKPIVRGQFGRRLLLLVDSVRHRSQDWGLDHAPEVDPFIADELEVVRGAAGVRYGPGAIGGAIIAKPPALLQKPGLAGEAHLMGYLARGGGFATRLQVAPESLRGFAYQVEGSAKRLASASTPDYALQNTGSLEWSAGGTMGYRTESSEYTVSARHYQSRLGVCPCLQIESSEDFLAGLEREAPANSEFFESSLQIERPYQAVVHDLVIARGRWQLGTLGKLKSTYALQFDHRQEFDVVRSASGAQFDFRLTTHDFDVELEHRPWHLSDHLHVRGSMGLVASAEIHSYRGLPLVPEHEAFAGGAFWIERLVGHDFEVEAGLRIDHLQRTASIRRTDFLRLVRSEQIAADACGTGDVDPVQCDSSFSTLSATLGGLKQFDESWSIKGNLVTASRPPDPDEQYLNGTSPTFPVLGLGKPDLGPETTYSVSVTGSYQGQRLALETSAYANYIADYVYFSPAIGAGGEPIFDVLVRGTFPRFITRPVDAVFYGTDGGLAYKPTQPLELSAQLSMVRAKNLTDNDFLVFVPPDKLRASARYSFEGSLGLDQAFVMLATNAVARQGRFNPVADLASPPDAYVLLDAEIGGQTQLSGRIVKFSLSGTNLTDHRYRDYTSLLRYFADQPGFQAMARLTILFSSSP